MISINSETSHPIEISHKIDELLQKLETYDFNGITLLNLFCYYENAGEFSRAEDMLSRLAARNDSEVNVVDEMRSFYKRLMEKSPEALSAGGMSQAQIRSKLNEWNNAAPNT
jgi:hypothetical protein